MGIYKPKGSKYWYATYTFHKVTHQQSLRVQQKFQALRIFAKWKSDIIEEKWFPKDIGKDKTLGELVEKFLEVCPERSKEAYKSATNTIVAYFNKNTRLERITPEGFSNFRVHLLKSYSKGSTVYILTVLKRMFNIATKEWAWFKVNPLLNVTISIQLSHRTRYLTPDEERGLLIECPDSG